MALCPWLGTESAIKVHTPHEVLQDELPSLSAVYLAQRVQAPDEGQALDEDVSEPRVGFAERVAGDCAVCVDEGKKDSRKLESAGQQPAHISVCSQCSLERGHLA